MLAGGIGRQFFALSAQMMQRILVDTAQARGAHKRGAGAVKVDVDDEAVHPSGYWGAYVVFDHAKGTPGPPGQARWSA